MTTQSDNLLRFYNAQYADKLRWTTGDLVRSKGYSAYATSLTNLLSAPQLSTLLSGAPLTPSNAATCASFQPAAPSTQLDRTTAAIRAGAFLLSQPAASGGARYVGVIDGGLLQSGGAGYDTHGDSVRVQFVNVFNVAAALAEIIDPAVTPAPGKISLADTLVILRTEFGRTPDHEGGTGRDHWPHGYVNTLIGGPVGSRAIAGSIGFRRRRSRAGDSEQRSGHQSQESLHTHGVPRRGADGRRHLSIRVGELRHRRHERFDPRCVRGTHGRQHPHARARRLREITMLRKIIYVAVITTIALLGGCSGCVPDLPETRDSDAGNYSWVRQAVPKIAGRKARGHTEVEVLADMIDASDRPSTLRAMLRQQAMRHEFVDHWGENVVDFMRAHRESGKQITGGNSCLGNAQRVGDYTLGLAQFVRDNGPVSTAPGAAYNLTDLLRSSLVLDDLSPAYRAYLFGMVRHPITGAEVTEQNKRDDLGVTLVQVYTHRQLGCLSCHNTIASTTGPQTFWNRHHPIRGRFTHGIFGQSTGRPADEVHAMLRTDVAFGGQQPWGMSSCGSFVPAASVPNDSFTTPGGTPLNAFFIEPRGRTGSVWQLETALDTGVRNIAAHGLRRGQQAGTSSGQCSYCTSSGSCPTGSGTAIPPLNPTQIAQENAARNALQAAGCFGCHGSGSGGLTMTSANFPARTVGTHLEHRQCQTTDLAGRRDPQLPVRKDQLRDRSAARRLAAHAALWQPDADVRHQRRARLDQRPHTGGGLRLLSHVGLRERFRRWQ